MVDWYVVKFSNCQQYKMLFYFYCDDCKSQEKLHVKIMFMQNCGGKLKIFYGQFESSKWSKVTFHQRTRALFKRNSKQVTRN